MKELVIPSNFPKVQVHKDYLIPEIINPFVKCGNSPLVEIVLARNKGQTNIRFPHNH